jgi:putative Holliday junction resolvase
MKSSNPLRLVGDIIGLDLGMSRTGVARLNTVARIAEPLDPIFMLEADIQDAVSMIVAEYSATAIVVGLPRGLDGQETDQTAWVRHITELLEESVTIPIFFTDEAGTTKQAEGRAIEGESVDSVAAGIIVEDFAVQVMQGRIENVSF